jgi:hypothetical protein
MRFFAQILGVGEGVGQAGIVRLEVIKHAGTKHVRMTLPNGNRVMVPMDGLEAALLSFDSAPLRSLDEYNVTDQYFDSTEG